MKKTTSQIQATHQALKKAKGEIEVRLWVPANKRDLLRAIAAIFRDDANGKPDHCVLSDGTPLGDATAQQIRAEIERLEKEAATRK